MYETGEEFRRRVGRIEIGRSNEISTRGETIGHFVASVVLLGVLIGVAAWLLWPVLLPLFVGLGAFAVYCAISYFIRVHPNHDHVREQFGDFRLSDDINRYLIVLVILLVPGRFFSVGIVDGVRLFVSGRLPHELPTSERK